MERVENRRSRWLIVIAVSVAQLMVVLDATITSVALPSAQRALGFSADTRQWVVTAYALSFGSLLLLGGRLGDHFARKWTFIGGLLGFAGASAVGGGATSFGMLVGARAAQGAFAALLAPSALALLTTTFVDPGERGKAFGVFAAVASTGSALGMLLGGVLTEWLSWRWALYVNLAFAIPVALGSVRLLQHEIPTVRPPIDRAGVLTVTAGLFALVCGLANSETHGWGDVVTVATMAAAVLLLTLFVWLEARARQPLLPLHVVAHRARGGAFLAVFVAGSAIFAVSLFLTYYMQQNKGYSPLQTGLGFLPLAATIMLTAPRISAVWLARFGPRILITSGMIAGASAMVWLTRLSAGSSYAGGVLPALIVLGLAMAAIMAPSFATATQGVDPEHAGAASGMVNTAQQVGGAVGTALLSSIFASAVTHSNRRAPGAAAIHGYRLAFWVAAGLFALGAVAVGAVLRTSRVRAVTDLTEDRDIWPDAQTREPGRLAA
jgi:EmrB/QacA subfamily drug resistance transporter